MNKRLWILYAGIAMAMVGYGIAMPLLPFYIEAFGGSGSHLGLLIAAYGLMQLCFAPLWGSLSDRYGRKPFLMLGMAGLSLAMLGMGLASRLWMLYAAQLAGGALSCATYPAAMASVSDQLDGDERTAAIGRIGAAAGFGIIIGPGIGGLLAFNSLSTPFFLASLMCLLTLVFMAWGIEETRRRKEAGSSQASPAFVSPGKLAAGLAGPMAFGLIAAFSVNFGKSTFTSIYGLFALEKFGFGPREVGLLLMVMSLMYAVAQGVLVGPLTRRLGEETLMSLLFPAISLAFLLLVAAGSALTLVAAVACFMLFIALLKPTALSCLSRQAGDSQGAAMGIAESFMSIGRIAGPLAAGSLFDLHMNAPYLMGMIFFLLLFIVGLAKKNHSAVSGSAFMKQKNYPV